MTTPRHSRGCLRVLLAVATTTCAGAAARARRGLPPLSNKAPNVCSTTIYAPHALYYGVRVSNTRTVSARLPGELVQRLDRTAREQSRSRTGQLHHILRDALARADSQQPTPTPEASDARRVG